MRQRVTYAELPAKSNGLKCNHVDTIVRAIENRFFCRRQWIPLSSSLQSSGTYLPNRMTQTCFQNFGSLGFGLDFSERLLQVEQHGIEFFLRQIVYRRWGRELFQRYSESLNS